MEKALGEVSTNSPKNTLVDSESIHLLSPYDPIDAEIIKYKKQIEKETTPTQLQQKEMIKKINLGIEGSPEELIAANLGFIATIVYAYKSSKYTDPQQLLELGSTALIESVASYDIRNSKVSFTNHAAPYIQAALQQVAPEIETPHLKKEEDRPIHGIYKFLSRLRAPRTVDIDAIEQENKMKKAIILHNAELIKLIPYTDVELFNEMGLRSDTFYHELRILYDVLNVPNRASLALDAKHAGIEFDISPVPDDAQLTPTERKIAPYLHLNFSEVAQKLGYSRQSIMRASGTIRHKLGARSRTELVLMLDAMDLSEPAPKPKIIEEFTPFELKVLPLLQYETSTIMKLSGLTNSAIQSAINKSFGRTETNSRQGLALNLYERGFEFHIPEPMKPFGELFHEKQMDVLKNLHLTRPELAQLGNMTEHGVASFIYDAQQKTGAKTQTELLLMARMYDLGERRKKDGRSTG